MSALTDIAQCISLGKTRLRLVMQTTLADTPLGTNYLQKQGPKNNKTTYRSSPTFSFRPHFPTRSYHHNQDTLTTRQPQFYED